MNKPPAFQFYVDNFVEGTCDLTPHDVGCYMRLLCFQWTRGSIPDDKAKLERIAGGKVSADVLAKFKDGKNSRLEKEREKQAEWRRKSQEGGLKSAALRAGVVQPPLTPPFTPPLQANSQPNGNTPSPSPSPSSDKACSTKSRKLSRDEKELADRIESLLASQWKIDGTAGKWLNRITGRGMRSDGQPVIAQPKIVKKVCDEMESAIKQRAINESHAQYAEYIWKQFTCSPPTEKTPEAKQLTENEILAQMI